MASVDDKSIISVEQFTWIHHDYLYTFKVQNFPPLQSLQYMKVWSTGCSANPTKWRIIVRFIKTGPPVYFVCILIVRRIDIKEKTVKVSCIMDMFDNKFETLVDQRGFPLREARYGEEFKEVYDPVLSNKAIAKLPDKILLVRVRLSVTSCHGPRTMITPTRGFTFDDLERMSRESREKK